MATLPPKNSNKPPEEPGLLAENRSAHFHYEILETFEAGIVLTGAEVKSCRFKHINIKPAYAAIENGQVVLKQSNISPYKQAADLKYNPERVRHLLLNKKEIHLIEKNLKERGLTLLPLKAYIKKGRIKILLGLGKGKKLHDKRDSLKKKAQDLEIKRVLKRY